MFGRGGLLGNINYYRKFFFASLIKPKRGFWANLLLIESMITNDFAWKNQLKTILSGHDLHIIY